MIIDLADDDRELQFFEEIKALATKLSHKNNSEKKIARDFYAIIISSGRKEEL